MSGHKINLGKGWRFDKDGKPVRSEKRLNVSARIAKRKAANKPRVVSRARAGGVA